MSKGNKNLLLFVFRMWSVMIDDRLPLWPHGKSVGLLTSGYGHAVWEVRGSNLGRDTLVGGVFHPTWQLARFSLPDI